MSEQSKIMEAYLEMVSEASCGKDRMKKEEKTECPKCEGKGCNHCDDKGYHDEVKEDVISEEMNGFTTKTLKRHMKNNLARAVKQGVAEVRTVKFLKNKQAFEVVMTQTAALHIEKALEGTPFEKVDSKEVQHSGMTHRKITIGAKKGVKESVELDEKKELDPVDDKANDKKFKDRKDKDIDNDGDVDSSDEYLHKRRAATDDAIDAKKKDSPVKKNPKTSDAKAEISKIGEGVDTNQAFEVLWSEIEEALNQKKGATEPEKMDSKASGKEKEFVAKHPIDKKDHDELEKVEEPKERKVKKEDVNEFEVIRALLSGNPEGEK